MKWTRNETLGFRGEPIRVYWSANPGGLMYIECWPDGPEWVVVVGGNKEIGRGVTPAVAKRAAAAWCLLQFERAARSCAPPGPTATGAWRWIPSPPKRRL